MLEGVSARLFGIEHGYAVQPKDVFQFVRSDEHS